MDPQKPSHNAYELKRLLAITLLNLSLMVGGIACAPTFTGPTDPSGYRFSLQAYPSPIWLPNHLSFGDPQRFPSQSTLTVKVQNAQGQPVDGVPVIFSLPSGWNTYASLVPQRVITQNGKAEAVFQATTTGAVEVTAQVENQTQAVFIHIERPVSGPPGGAE
jgi:Bacterial Ig-like domain (group 1)